MPDTFNAPTAGLDEIRAKMSLISASAGSGKTSRITDEIRDALGGRSPGSGGAAGPPAPMAAEQILATTFTKLAAGELLERTREKLLADPALTPEAPFLNDALIGTVNAVCGRLLADHAFDAGLPPVQTVLEPAARGAVFAAAVSVVLQRYGRRLDPVAERLSSTKRAIDAVGGCSTASSWQEYVERIIELARSNLLSSTDLHRSMNASVCAMLALVPKCGSTSARRLDQELIDVLEAADAAIGAGDGSKVSNDGVRKLRQARAALRRSRKLPWSIWLALSKVKVSKALDWRLEPLRAVASRYEEHPRFRADLKAFVKLCFLCAIDCLDAFRVYKARHGLIDFCDQETLAYDLLGRPDLTSRLRTRVRCFVVDEFQDTSPIQLAVFQRILRLAERAVWVGDIKQSIYGFRGTAPELMEAMIAALGLDLDAPGAVLSHSYRSRAGLVRFANRLFVPAYGARGMPEQRVRLEPVRSDLAGMGPPLEFWDLTGSKVEVRCQALAEAVRGILDRPGDRRVCDRTTGEARNLVAGDIAILARSRKSIEVIVAALAEQGIRASVEQPGLLATEEARLALAALRAAASRDDTLACAELIHVTGRQPDEWLADWIADGAQAAWTRDPRIIRLRAVGDQLIDLTPTEAFDMALAAGSVTASVREWPDSARRLANLDALRALAARYENFCRSERLAATVHGLITWLTGSGNDAQRDRQPPAADEGAVNVLTYHGAKGLEWPLVILADLHDAKDPWAFGVEAMPNPTGVDPLDPLHGRTIRFWPWPFLGTTKQVSLLIRAQQTREYADLDDRCTREALNLLYVGVTRARDYLILAAQAAKLDWLDIASSVEAAPLTFPPPGTGIIACDGEDVPCRSVSLSFSGKPAASATADPAFFVPDLPAHQEEEPLPARVAASRLVQDAPFAAEAYEVIELPEGVRLRINGGALRPEDDRLGTAVHLFLAADDPVRPVEERRGLARGIMDRWDLGAAMSPDDWIAAGNRLHAFLRATYGRYALLPEWPVHRRFADGREMQGLLDLLVDTDAGWVLVDHKTFKGNRGSWAVEAHGHRPQLTAYREAIEAGTSRPVVATYIHLALLGAMVRLL
jgi:ATP-dependent exoDNAse (exonuclease V) beta subunit